MKGLSRILAYLEAHGVPGALIGGMALSAHGIVRATLDADVLVADRTVLTAEFWKDLGDATGPDIRTGDPDDPLVGMVRFAGPPDAVDVVVGRSPWTAAILSRCFRIQVGAESLAVVDGADLVVLKLFAGGPQDLVDVRLLLAADPGLETRVEQRLGEAPRAARRVWAELQGRDRSSE
jgi:hypothetical protein